MPPPPPTPSTSTRLKYTIPFTPGRRPSLIISPDELPSRSTTPNQLSNAKRYKAPLSAESKPRNRQPNGVNSVPGSPSRKGDVSRPKTPTTPRKTDGPMLCIPSEMDVSRVDPEEVLVDFQSIEAGDISADIDESFLKENTLEDKVLVSIRLKPSSAPVWDVVLSDSKLIKLNPKHAKSTTSPGSEFRFDEILTGSENKPIYNAVARGHVCAAMDGYNSVIFAYGQTASGKTFTLSGNEDQPGIIPRAMKDIFAYIRRTPSREYLLRCSYIEIYNETIHDLLAPPSSSISQPVQIQGSGSNVWLSPLREEVVTSLKSVKEVLARGESSRRTASTDWNERSSRSHSVFRVVIESRDRGTGDRSHTPNGRTTPGIRPPTPGGPRLQGARVQTSTLSLIDLAGSEKATSDKERTREGRYINTSLLTLGSVISTLGENAAKNKNDHVPFRNSKLTRMLQPSLSGDARISLIATINPGASATAESTSTLQFAQRIKKVQLNAQKREVVDTEALIERYRKEIEDLKRRLEDKEKEAPERSRRLSAREQMDESKAMKDLNSRIKQLTKLILTSQTVDEANSMPGSPVKVDFDMSPYQLQQELLSAHREIETQAVQILSLEQSLLSRPMLPPDAPESEKDKLIMDQGKTIRELEIVVKGYEDNLGEPLRAVREDVENEWQEKFDAEVKKREEKEAWANELVRQLEKEKKIRLKLEEERKALAAFVKKFDSLGLGGLGIQPPSVAVALNPPMPVPGGAHVIFAERQRNKREILLDLLETTAEESPLKVEKIKLESQPSLLEEQWDGAPGEDLSFEHDSAALALLKKTTGMMRAESPMKEIFVGKENLPT